MKTPVVLGHRCDWGPCALLVAPTSLAAGELLTRLHLSHSTASRKSQEGLEPWSGLVTGGLPACLSSFRSISGSLEGQHLPLAGTKSAPVSPCAVLRATPSLVLLGVRLPTFIMQQTSLWWPPSYLGPSQGSKTNNVPRHQPCLWLWYQSG